MAELEKSFGVSHIPIREAVRRLEAEGLIVALPQRAAVAAGVDLDDLAGLYDLRRIVECDVIRRSVDTMTDEQVEVVRAALETSRRSLRTTTRREFWELHRDVPLGAARAGRELLDPARPRARCGSPRSATSVCSSPRRSRTRWPTTASSSRLCERRDGDHAATLLRLHLDRTELAVRRAFASVEAAESRGLSACVQPIVSAYGAVPERRRAARARGAGRAGRRRAAAPPRSTRPISRSRPGPFLPAARRFRTCPGSRASAASSSRRASRRGRASGPRAEGSGSPPTGRSRSVRRRRGGARRGAGGADDVVAAAFGRVGPRRLDAADAGLHRSAPARAVLVLGATGSVGTVAVQAAKLLGAGRVVAAGRNAARLAAALRARAPTRPCRARRRRSPRPARRGLRRRAADARLRRTLGACRRGGRRRRRAGRADRATSASRPAPTRRSPRAVRGKQLQIFGYSNFAVPLDALARRDTAIWSPTRAPAGSGSTSRRVAARAGGRGVGAAARAARRQDRARP